MKRLDIVLPGENGQWWRRPVDGETPHLTLLCGEISDGSGGGGGGCSTGGSTAGQQYRGPVWTEERFSSGKPVTARVLVSARGDYLVEMEARDATRQISGSQRRAAAAAAATQAGREGCTPDVSLSPAAGDVSGGEANGAGARGVLRLELRAPELRAVFRGLDSRRGQQRERSMESLLAPDRRVELCR